MPDFTKVCFAVDSDIATKVEQLLDPRAQLAVLAAHFESLEATGPQTGDRVRGEQADIGLEAVGTGRHHNEGVSDRAYREVGARLPQVLDRTALVRTVTDALADHLKQKTTRREIDSSALTSPHNMSVQECVTLLGYLRDRLFPQGIAPTRPMDDTAPTLRPQENFLFHGQDWTTVASWEQVGNELVAAGAGSTAFLLARRPGGWGHAFAGYTVKIEKDKFEVVWIDLQNFDPSRRVSTDLPSIAPVEARALIIDRNARVFAPSQSTFQQSTSTAHALIDPSAFHQYGAIGVEAEFERWGVVMPANIRPDESYGHLLAQSDSLKVVMEDWDKSTPFIEIVSRPLKVLPGERNRPSKEKFFEQFTDLTERLTKANGSVRFLDIFSPSSGFTARRDILGVLRNVYLRPIPERADRISPQFTAGVPIDGLYDFLIHAHNETPEDALFLRQHINNGLRFGNELSSLFAGQSIPQLRGLRLSPQAADLLDQNKDVRALRGFLALVYTQVAAEAYWQALQAVTNEVPQSKNLTAIVSRTDLGAVRAALPGPVQRFLRENRKNVRDRFVARFTAGLVNDGIYSDEFRRMQIPDPLVIDIGVRGKNLGDYLDSALIEMEGVLQQYEVMGMHTTFLEMDTNAGNIDPVIPIELRFYGSDYQAPNEMLGKFDALSREVNRVYDEARRIEVRGPAQSSQQVLLLQTIMQDKSSLSDSLTAFFHAADNLDSALPPAMNDGLLLPTATIKTIALGTAKALASLSLDLPHDKALPAINDALSQLGGLAVHLASLDAALSGLPQNLLDKAKRATAALRGALHQVLKTPPPKIADLRNSVNLVLQRRQEHRVATDRNIVTAYQQLPPHLRSAPTPRIADAIADILQTGQIGRLLGAGPLTEPETPQQENLAGPSGQATSSTAIARPASTHRPDARATTRQNTPTPSTSDPAGPHKQKPAPRAFLDTPRGPAAGTHPADTANRLRDLYDQEIPFLSRNRDTQPRPAGESRTLPGPYIGRAETENTHTNDLNRELLQTKLDRLPVGDPRHTRVQNVLDTHQPQPPKNQPHADTDTQTTHAAAQATPHKEPQQEPVRPLRRDTESHRYLLDTRLLPPNGTPAYTEHVETAAAMLHGPDTTPAQQKTPPVVSIAEESKTEPLSTIQATDFLRAIIQLPHTPSTIQLDLGHAAHINICR